MTFTEDSSSTSERPSILSDWRRRYFQKRYLCSWILAAVLPFVLLRLTFMSEIAFPFQWTSRSPMNFRSKEHTPQGESLAPGPALKSKTTPESASFIRPDEDAWITHDDWINHDLHPRDDKRKEDHPLNPNGKENLTELMKPFPSKTNYEDNFGLPKDNEKEELEFDPSETTRKDGTKSNEDLMAVEETRTKDKDKSEAKDRFEKENVEKHNDENVVGQQRADEHREPAEKSPNDEENAPQDREAEANGNFEENREREAAKGKDGRNSKEGSSVDERGDIAPESNSEEKQKGGIEGHSKAAQGGSEDRKPEETTSQGRNQPKSEVMNPSEEQHEPEEKVGKEAEELHQQDETSPGGKCDLFEGVWEYDPEGPLYTNSTCFYIQAAQNCMSNGRPDTEYMHWRWKPRDCDLPRFDAKSFLDSFRGKAIGFVGDSIARNQMQSLLCLLSQVEIPITTYVSADDQTVRWLFKEHQVTLAVVWSSHLLKESSEGLLGFAKGQWFYKSSVYIKQSEVVGCHSCPTLNLTDMGFYQAYREAIRQVLEKVSNEYKGIAIMSTFPLSHFENGTWDTGGYCKRKLPLEPEESKIFPGDHNILRDIVVDEVNSVINEKGNMGEDVGLEILDVTRVSLQRADGHPGPFRRPHPFEGRDPDVFYPNDCLHWCLPGPIEAWNQLVVKVVEKYL